MCNTCREEIINIQTGEKLDFVQVEGLENNSMLKVKPELWRLWNFWKNNELGLDIYKITYGSGKSAWWYCEKCNDSYPQRISVKTRGRGNGCSICRGFYVTTTNSLSSLRPDISSHWHPTLNGDKMPHMFTCGSDENVWWICEKGHEYSSTIANRCNAKGCPYCSNKSVLIGYNDMWTTNPELASKLLNPEDGYKYVEGSNEYVNWKCPDCNSVIENRQINSIRKNKLACSNCSDGIKYPEKLMMIVLNYLKVKFIHDTPFDWSNKKRYDFYIPSLNMIIETHGEQHKNGRFNRLGGRTLKEEQVNDKFKYELAINNGIEKYIVIDCEYSEFEFIKNNILNSEINNYFNLNTLDWTKIGFESLKSLVIEICDIYNNNHVTAQDISKMTNLSVDTIYRYLKQGAEIGICSYEANSEKHREIGIQKLFKPVIQLDLNGEFVREFDSIKEASESFGKKKISAISACCKGKLKSTQGFRWMFKNDYLDCIEGKSTFPTYKDNKVREVIQLSLDGELIKKYSSVSEAERDTGINNVNIIACCKKKYQQAGGFRWFYLDDYEKFIKENKSFDEIENKQHRKVIQLTKEGEYVKEFDKIRTASKNTNVDEVSICACCNENRNTAGGYMWMYKEDYEHLIKNKLKIIPKKNKKAEEVVQLDGKYELVSKYDSISEASRKTGINDNSIGLCCRGARNHAGNYKWMYLSDYEQYLKQQNNKEIS